MGTTLHKHSGSRASKRASVLIIVLWIAFGLVSLALYFANSMNFELRASDNRVSAMTADEAIEGAARYVNYLLTTEAANGSNGVMPILADYQCQAVPIGDAHYWVIGRNNTNPPSGPGQLCFGLVDEASKLNLNTAPSNAIVWLPRMTLDLTQAILDWRDTNGGGPTTTYYAMQNPSYQCKNDPFETVNELRLLYGADMDILLGEDANCNGVLDPNENDANQNNQVDPGIVEYLTVYTREPNTNSDGSAKINIASPAATDASRLNSLLQTSVGSSRASEILRNINWSVSAASGRTGAGAGQTAGRPSAVVSLTSYRCPLLFYSQSKMSLTEFAQIATNLTTTTNSLIEGRVNVNSASLTVLTCLVGGDTAGAQQLFSYRLANPGNLTSIAWVADALGGNFPDDLQALEAGDYLTTQTYQFTADVAALGPHGRGYRRVKFVFDTCSGTPQIVYRQDLTHLGWALGKDVRQDWVLASRQTP